jgi:hypothetical protein
MEVVSVVEYTEGGLVCSLDVDFVAFPVVICGVFSVDDESV